MRPIPKCKLKGRSEAKIIFNFFLLLLAFDIILYDSGISFINLCFFSMQVCFTSYF